MLFTDPKGFLPFTILLPLFKRAKSHQHNLTNNVTWSYQQKWLLFSGGIQFLKDWMKKRERVYCATLAVYEFWKWTLIDLRVALTHLSFYSPICSDLIWAVRSSSVLIDKTNRFYFQHGGSTIHSSTNFKQFKGEPKQYDIKEEEEEEDKRKGG